jgi:hypothetical protein
MIDSKPGFGLPLVYHLVQQGVLHLGPCVPCDVTSADRDIERSAGPDLDGQLTQPGAHAAGEPDRDLAQRPTEVLRVQSLMKAGEPVQQDQITRASSLPRARPRPGWRVRLNRKRQELALGRPAEHPRHSRIQEPDNRLEHAIRSKGIASVNPENTLTEAEHHGAVSMGKDPVDLLETEHGQTIPEQREQLLPRFPAFHPPRGHPPRHHSP